ncbi:DNA replication regulator SLD3-domain-containing protein [Podospora didyma]|uniref:DNA replication regulator SLD3-domain-containing protein n=1 Tax=Podospora didyma TaxID=330526 RepID=A0AAE0P7K9_9PEZI|nr:DNA replication regulator SLD3-domain-containing protein [Podospora didyma]
MSSIVRPSSSALSRPPSSGSGILAPVSTTVLNQTNSIAREAYLPSSDSRKRKRPEQSSHAPTADHLLKAPVILKPHPSGLTARPRMLQPLMLLPREHLPLSALDLSQPNGDFPASRLFESKIKILDLEGRLGSNVLLARSETNRMVYAIEREGNGLYVLCKLGTWVDMEKLALSATVVCPQGLKLYKPIKVEESSVFPMITPHMHKESKRRRLAIEEIQSMVRKRPSTDKDSASQGSALKEQAPSPTADVEIPTESSLPLAEARDDSVLPAVPNLESLLQPTAEDIFQNVRMQYFEALYHSMGSLAYFAKGPLSRARAAFHLDYDSNLEMNDLIDFLKSLVMTTVLIDKKYRETVPEIVSKLKTLVEDSDNGDSKSRKRKPKKPKLGKDGLYPSEYEHVKKWWAIHESASNSDDDKSVRLMETKYHISCLRRRETQLQMILILEILALEPLRRPTEAVEESLLPGADSQAASREASQEPATRKQNRNNLPVLLDVHADRLCIWQTTTTDEVKAMAESQLPVLGDDSQKATSDPLRDFCVDIIVPFFSARLPELCDSINRKLGGPVVQSPPREKQPKHAVTSKSRPGAPAKRPAAFKNDKERALERVLSKERMRRSASRGPSGAIALMRTASATTIPGLKREASEPLLAMIPRGEKSSLKEKSSGLFPRATLFATTGNSRAKQKTDVEAELKEAISALKKPNRALVGKEVVEEAEKRVSVGVSQLKKLKKPTRISAVQVKATPANSRFKDVIAAEGQMPRLNQPFNSAMDSVPSSSSVVPSSTVHRKFANMLGTSTAAASPQIERVQATPSKPASVAKATLQDPQQNDNILSSSPIMTRKAAPMSGVRHPLVSTIRFGNNYADLPSSPGLVALFETPVNPRSTKNGLTVLNDTPIRSRLPAADAAMRSEKNVLDSNAGAEKTLDDVNIYQRLGWDEEDFD